MSREDPAARLVERLVADARPVRRIWPVRARLAAWVTLMAAFVVAVAVRLHRPDLAIAAAGGGYLLELTTFGALAVVLAAYALASAVPGARLPRGTGTAACALAAAGALLALREPLDRGVTLEQFVAHGLPCAWRTAVCAVLPWCLLLAAVRRGAPLGAARAGAWAGGAGFVAALVLMRLLCANDDPLHVVVWHQLPVLAGVAASSLLGLAWLWRWRGAPRAGP